MTDIGNQLARAADSASTLQLEESSRRFAASASEAELDDVAYAYVDTPVGELLVAVTRRGLVTVGLQRDWAEAALERIAAKLSPRVIEAPARLDRERRQLEEYFDGKRKAFDLPLDWRLVRGPFSKRVLEETWKLGYGETMTYTQAAERAGSKRAFRAAGNALGSNPIPIVVPCHRVLASGGGLGGYGGGLDMKRHLLRLEGAARA